MATLGAGQGMRRRHRAAHARIWVVLAVVLPAVILGALVLRQGGAGERPAVLLRAPQAP